MSEKNRINFGTKIGVVAAAAGSAVGLGNIWRFPYELGQYGGGAFLIIYLACVVLLGMPVMMSEFIIGRRGQANAAGAFRKLAPGTGWWLVGLIGILTAFLILGFYIVVSGWTLEYIVQAVGNGFAGKDSKMLSEAFTNFSTGTFRPLVWMIVFTLVAGGIVLAGVTKGIERSAKFLMPLLLLIIIAMVVRSVTLPKGIDGVRFLFQPDFSKITSGVILSAMGQAFFSLSLGMGCMITYGSYINKKNNLGSTVAEVTLLDTLVAILAASAIFPAVFSLGINPAQGPELVFITLPNVFSHMPGGYVWAILFFVLLSVAALTSVISLLEVIVAFFVEQFRFSRIKTIIITSIGVTILGVMSSFSLGLWKDVTIFGQGFFSMFDSLTSKIFMPAGGMFIALFAAWKIKKADLLDELSSNGKFKTGFFVVYLFLVRYVAPIGIFLIFLNQLGLFKWLGAE